MSINRNPENSFLFSLLDAPQKKFYYFFAEEKSVIA